jgi:hypothetical protein
MRRALLAPLIALLVVSSGCVGLITGDTAEFESEPATVDDAALESTGYEQRRSDTQNVTRNVSFAGQERTIRVVNHINEYDRSIDLGPLGEIEFTRFIVFSTPGAEVAGQTLNPAADWSNRRVVEEIAQRSGSVDDVQFERNRTVTSLGESREVGVFSGTTEVEGQEIDVRIHVASFEHEGDVLIVAAVHPERIDEEDRVDTLYGGIEHSGE